MDKAPTLLEYTSDWLPEIAIEAVERNPYLTREKAYMIFGVKATRFYAQIVTLGMFIPCDEEGKPMEEPVGWDYFKRNGAEEAANYFGNGGALKMEACLAYQSALDRRVFKGWYVVDYVNNEAAEQHYYVLYNSTCKRYLNCYKKATYLHGSYDRIEGIDALINQVPKIQFTQSIKEKLKLQ